MYRSVPYERRRGICMHTNFTLEWFTNCICVSPSAAEMWSFKISTRFQTETSSQFSFLYNELIISLYINIFISHALGESFFFSLAISYLILFWLLTFGLSPTLPLFLMFIFIYFLWGRGALEGKGLKVNVGKSKVMVSSADAGETEKTGEYPSGVCYADVGANSIRCNNCTNWVHRRCSGIYGSLQAAKKTFICKRCQGMFPQRDTCGIAKGPELQGRKYETVEKFCYLGDMLAARRGETAAVTARIQSAWEMFRELSPVLTSRGTQLKVKGKVYDACFAEMHDLW